MRPVEAFTEKATSGRFLSTCLLVTTYCAIPFLLVYLIVKGKLDANFFTGYIAGFAQTVLLVLKFYFDRSDRHVEPDKKNGAAPLPPKAA